MNLFTYYCNSKTDTELLAKGVTEDTPLRKTTNGKTYLMKY